MSNRIISRQLGFDSNYKAWHHNGKNMIIYMHSDGGSIVCNERIYPIKKGVLCFIGSKKYHYTMSDNIDVYERSKIFISNGDLNRLVTLAQKKDTVTEIFGESSIVYAQIAESDMNTVDAIFKDVANYADNESYGDMILAASLMRLLVFISENTVDAISLPKGSVYKAIEYINANIREALTVDGICERVHTSKYHFCRSFKKATGLTVMNYILKTRITLAKTMLASERSSVSEISEACGFGNPSVFCRAFKENTSMTPLQYRRHKSKI